MPFDSRRLPVPENSTPPCVFSSVLSTDIVKPVCIDYGYFFTMNKSSAAENSAIQLLKCLKVTACQKLLMWLRMVVVVGLQLG